MREKVENIVDYLMGKDIDYADVRCEELKTQNIKTEDGSLQDLNTETSRGVGIRVFDDGAMGFAATGDLDRLHQTALKAIEVASASKIAQKRSVELAEKEVVEDYYETPCRRDPFAVDLDEKIELLLRAESEMNGAAELHKTSASMRLRREGKIFADTEGSLIEQELVESGAGIEASALGEDDLQVRTHPCSFGGNHARAGYEFIEELDLVGNAGETAREAAQLAGAEDCPEGEFDLILDSSQLALQIHESIGHPIELDRVFGAEEAYAGTSFLDVDDTDSLRYGSEHVNVVADATVPGGLGTFGYDDEGVPAQSVNIIEDGIFRGFLTSRDTAARLDSRSAGASRADGWNNLPLIRMTNINLLPGSYELDELIAEVDYGLYLDTNRSWSIDDRRLNFQFSCEIAYEIEDGSFTGKIFKNPVYTGITPRFWKSCAGVAGEDHWQMYGLPNCGKGQPGQRARVGHGSAPALFKDIEVGVKDDE